MATSWVEECFQVLVQNCSITFLCLDDLQQKQLDISVFSRRKDIETGYYFTFSFLHIYKLKFVQNNLSNVLLYYGDLIEKGAYGDFYYFTALISIPTKKILIKLQGEKKHRQIQRFLHQMGDTLRTSTLLRVKEFAMGEDIHFD
jgi:hypothetical protein